MASNCEIRSVIRTWTWFSHRSKYFVQNDVVNGRMKRIILDNITFENITFYI